MNPSALIPAAIYMLASIACFTMEQGLRKTKQPVFAGPVSSRIFRSEKLAFAAWLAAALREHLTEVLLRFVPLNVILAGAALAGKASVTNALALAIGLSLLMATIEHFWTVGETFKFALGRRLISAMGSAFSALAWLMLLTRI